MGGHGILYSSHLKSGGTRPTCPPPNCDHVTNHDFGPDYKTTLAQIARIAPSEYTLYWKSFHRSRFLSNLRLPWKNRTALKFFTVLNILFTFRIFNNLRLPWKQSFPWNFSLYWIYFLSFRIFEQLCVYPEKQSCPGIFHCIEYTFYIQEFWRSCMRFP